MSVACSPLLFFALVTVVVVIEHMLHKTSLCVVSAPIQTLYLHAEVHGTRHGAGRNEGARVCRHQVVGEVDMMIWMVQWELGWGAHFLGKA